MEINLYSVKTNENLMIFLGLKIVDYFIYYKLKKKKNTIKILFQSVEIDSKVFVNWTLICQKDFK